MDNNVTIIIKKNSFFLCELIYLHFQYHERVSYLVIRFCQITLHSWSMVLECFLHRIEKIYYNLCLTIHYIHLKKF